MLVGLRSVEWRHEAARSAAAGGSFVELVFKAFRHVFKRS